MYQNSRHPVLRFLPTLILLIVLPLLLLWAAGRLGGRADGESLDMARQAIRRAAVQCYALEGTYPVSWQHLKEVYCESVDESRYFVDYQYVASNLMPDITVLPLEGRESPIF